jgi:hypothetical protein
MCPSKPSDVASAWRCCLRVGANVGLVVIRSRRLSALLAVAISVATPCGCGGAGDAAQPIATVTQGAADFAAMIRQRVTADAWSQCSAAQAP